MADAKISALPAVTGNGASADEFPVNAAGATQKTTLLKIRTGPLNGTLGATTPAAATVTSMNGGQLAGLRNRIINGNMRIDQRVVAGAVSGVYTLDRWLCTATTSVLKVTDGPVEAGSYFNTAIEINAASGSPTLAHRIEAANCVDLVGSFITVSFWAKRVSGTPAVRLNIARANGVDGFSSGTTSIQETGVIAASSALGTWVKYQVTSTAAMPVEAANGIQIIIFAEAGATVTRYTGIQLEQGSVATPFEQRPIGLELALCQRYYYRAAPAFGSAPFGVAFAAAATEARVIIHLPVPLRIRPTAMEQNGVATDYAVRIAAADAVCNAVPTFNSASTTVAHVGFPVASGLTAGQAGDGRCAGGTTAGYLGWSVEL